MATTLVASPEMQAYLDRIAGIGQAGGDARTKEIFRKVVSDLFDTIEEFDVSPEEFWRALHFLQAGAMEFGLIAPGFGFDHFLDVRMDIADRAAGRAGGTPRTIEGPLYVPGAPLEKGYARLDDGSDTGGVLIVHGVVRDAARQPVAGALVDVWHANTRGTYSGFDPNQSAYNMRRRIETGEDGAYRFRTIMPSGYAAPPGGATEKMLQAVGRHGNRPAHIHFFVSAPGHRHLTTQINIPGDPYVYDDFAFATHDDLVPEMTRSDDPARIAAEGLDGPFDEIAFDFVLLKAAASDEEQAHARPRAAAVG
jgi:catechol 1,2-dioxygenase